MASAAIENDFVTCSICMNEYNEYTRKPKVLPCSHTVCFTCLQGIFQDNAIACPYCRQSFKLGGYLDVQRLPNNNHALHILKLNQQIAGLTPTWQNIAKKTCDKYIKPSRPCFKCNEEGHMSYNCPTDPNRGRGGGRGGITRPCFKCNQDGHLSYNCPSTGGRGARNSLASIYGAPSSNTVLSAFDDKGTITVTPDTKPSSFDSGEKKNDMGSASDKASSPWATGVNTASRGARNTPTSSYNARIVNSQPVLDYLGIASNSSAATPATTIASSCTIAGIPATDDWGSANANASKRGSASNANTLRMIPSLDKRCDSRPGEVSDRNIMTRNQEISLSDPKRNFWNGTFIHGGWSFKAGLDSLVDDTRSVLADLEMPKSIRVVGTVEPEKVWAYLRKVSETNQTIAEHIVVFQITPATSADIEGYKFFYDELNFLDMFAVIAGAQDSKLPLRFKAFYVVPLGKESPLPFELPFYVKPSFQENRNSDYVIGVVVVQAPPAVDQPMSNASLPRRNAVGATQSDAESEKIKNQETQNSESTLVASAQPPPRITTTGRQLQQDTLSVCPVKAKIQSNSSQLKSSLSRPTSVVKSISVLSSSAIAESKEENTPIETTPATNKPPFNQGQPIVDGEMLTQKQIFEELNRQVGVIKHGKLTEATMSVSPIASSSLESPSGQSTRSKQKRTSVPEESCASKRFKNVVSSKEPNLSLTSKEKGKSETEGVQAHISSRKSRSPSTFDTRLCFEDGCSSDAQTNSVYCANHVGDSLHAMSEKSSQLQESHINSLTPPSTSSDQPWKDSVDFILLVNQKTGKVLCDYSAPNVCNVEQKLKDNSTYVIVKHKSQPTIPATASSSKDDGSKTSSMSIKVLEA
ncbi:uncharacterized protein LOC124196771 isoform X3 [Daphnia pulex]|uniref:uncharacterized protein LOC124196771 isoform X3 n=1 Tax=Daphnia pulex TaxID=6669 RepID=UPI001EDCE47D|nr:uncharacterized protein LOC124196771 isoform X3 [Daphnia pulex]